MTEVHELIDQLNTPRNHGKISDELRFQIYRLLASQGQVIFETQKFDVTVAKHTPIETEFSTETATLARIISLSLLKEVESIHSI